MMWLSSMIVRRTWCMSFFLGRKTSSFSGPHFPSVFPSSRWKGQDGDLAPERFNPDRWLAPDVIKGGAGSWIPFGGGPRMCLGLPLATAEVKVIVVIVTINFIS